MKKIGKVYPALIAAMCLFVCAVVFLSNNNRVSAQLDPKNGDHFYCSDDINMIKLPIIPQDREIFLVVARKDGSEVKVSDRSLLAPNKDHIELKLPDASHRPQQQDYYICFTDENVQYYSFERRMNEELARASCDGETFSVSFEGEGKTFDFKRVTVEKESKPLRVTDVKVGGKPWAESQIISKETEIDIEVWSKNELDIENFTDNSFYTYYGYCKMVNVEESEGTEGHVFKVKYLFGPAPGQTNMSAGLFADLKDNCSINCSFVDDEVTLRIDTNNIGGSFEDDDNIPWTNSESVKLVLNFSEDEEYGVNYLDMLTTDDLTVLTDDFDGQELALKKDSDGVRAEVTLKCSKDHAAEAFVEVGLDINRDNVNITKTFKTDSSVKMDRVLPEIEVNEVEYESWNARKAYLNFVVRDRDSQPGSSTVRNADDESGSEETPDDLTGGQYRYEIIVEEGSAVETMTFVITAYDVAGNKATKKVKDMQVLIDNAPPGIEIVEAKYFYGYKSVDLDEDWFNQMIYIAVKLRDTGSGISEDTIRDTLGFEYPGAVSSDVSIKVEKMGEDEAEAQVIITPYDESVYTGTVRLTVKDNAGLRGFSDEFDLNIDTQEPYISDIIFEKVGAEGEAMPQYVGDKGSVKIRIKTNDLSGSGIDTLKIKMNGAKNFIIPKRESKDKAPWFTAVVPIDGDDIVLDDGEKIALTDLVLSDKAGNKLTFEALSGTESEIYYYSAMKSDEMGISYGPKDGGMLVKDGDEIVLSFSTRHEIEYHDSIVIGRRNGEFDWESAKNDDGLTRYTGTYTVKHMPENDNSEFDTNAEIVDKAGNSVTLDTKALGKKIRYYAPIEDSISGLSFKVNGSDKPLAKNGDTLTVSFRTKHPVNVNNARIAGKSVKFTADDDLRYTAQIVIASGQLKDDSVIGYSFELSDEAGNKVYKADQSMTSAVRYYAPLSVDNIKMSSDNKNTSNTAAKNGDTVTVTFVTNHPSEIREASVGGKKVSFTSSDKKNWTARIKAAEGMAADMSYLPLKLVVADAAGNDAVTKTENDLSSSKVKYVAPISISDVKFTGTNEKDPSKSAKNGDTIKVSFTANHNVTIKDAVIASKKADVSVVEENGEKRRYELKVSIGDGDLKDQADIHFSFTATDMAANEPVSMSDKSLGTGTIRYYAPITTEVSISADGKNSAYVKNGGRITVTGTANHPVKPEKCKIMGRDANGSGGYLTTYTVFYDIPEGERKLGETNADMEFVLTDAAGNTLNVNAATDESSVLYDRTSPSLSAEYDNVNFTNSTMSYRFIMTDRNLSPQDISIKVNGKEQITDEERKALTGTVFVKDIVVDSDDNYTITASAADRAGNSAEPLEIRMTVDKTAPDIKTVKISRNKPGIYKSDFLIRDFLEIDEANLKEIIVTVTNADGTTDWDINEPITTEGKNTVYIVATDMANNTSDAVTFDLYIDTTAPKPIITETKSGLFLYTDRDVVFTSQADIEVSLEPLHIEGVSEPDEFKKLCITDKDGNVLYDLLDGYETDEKGKYFISLTAQGEYRLVIEAEDQVGNNTGEMRYVFRIEEQTVIAKVSDNKLLAVGTATGGTAIVIIAGCAVILRRFRRKRLG